MSIPNSPFLNDLCQYARSVKHTPDAPLTADRYMIALTDLLLGNVSFDTTVGFVEILVLISKCCDNIKKNRDALLSTLVNEDENLEEQVAHMERLIKRAKERAEDDGKAELSAVELLRTVLEDPSPRIRQLFLTPTAENPEHLSNEDSELARMRRELRQTLDDLNNLWNSEPAEPEEEEEEKKSAPTTPTFPPSTGVSESTASEEPRSSMPRFKGEPRVAPQQPSGDVGRTDDPRIKIAELTDKVKEARKILSATIFGQDNAIDVFTTGYFQAELLSMTDKKRVRPRAIYLFAGPPGVGKTFLAEKAAEVLDLPFARFDMSEYSDKEANLEFCGSDKVYKNGSEGNVTGFVAKHPKCVLLFDEIEKAHINVIHLFLQMLDAGRLRDNFTDEEVSFTETYIIFTTNAGKQLYEESESCDFSGLSRKTILKALQKDTDPSTGIPYFPGAICSRLATGNVVMFNHITASNLREIAKREAIRHATNFEKEIGIRVSIDERVYTALMFAEGAAADARTVRARAESFFDDELFELFRLTASEKVSTGISNIESIHIGIELPENEPELLAFFTPVEQPKILLFSSDKVAKLCQSKKLNASILHVSSISEATDLMHKHRICAILVDPTFGVKGDLESCLNMEDVESLSRDFLHYIREAHSDIPFYLLETDGYSFTEEDKLTFLRQGARDILPITKGNDRFAVEIDQICESLHQQESMRTLARSNKLITFNTSQRLSHHGKNAEIILFDFHLVVAVDAEDSKNILSNVSKPNVRFEDVIGAEDAKRELQYFVDYLRDPKKFFGTGLRAPKGILLYGPPGTGKTMLAKAMASESGVTFIAAEGNQFLKKYVGEGPAKVHELFATARKYAPAILFVDEIDAIAKERRGGEHSGIGEETLTAFLTEMDGFTNDPTKPVFVLAATNFDVTPGSAKSLDAALLRRFDRRVYIDLPNKDDRIRYIRFKMARSEAFVIGESMIENIAMRSTGMSLAELESVFELALRSAFRSGTTKVTDEILEEAFETFTYGEEKSWDVSELERTARHEAGHAFLCWHSGETPSYLTIVARGNHGGYMQHANRESKGTYTKDELLANIRTALGGRASEIVYYGVPEGISTGASGDLRSATNTARHIICTYGMDDSFGLAVIEQEAATVGELADEVRAAVNRILSEEMERAVKLITENKKAIDAIVSVLLSKNHLTADEIDKIFRKYAKRA